MMYRVLFMTDFSERSMHAMDFCKMFASASKSEVVLFHCVSPIVGSMTQMGVSVELTSILQDNAQETLSELEKEFDELHIDTKSVLAAGQVSSVLEDVIKENDINLIIMGTHGNSNLLDKIMGSTAAYVLTHLDTPTIVIPAKFHLKSIENVVFAHQLTAPKINHLLEAFNFINYMNVDKLDVVHIHSEEQEVYSPDTLIIEEIKSHFTHQNLIFHFEKDDSVVNGLYRFMKENKTDFLITSSNKKTFWKRLLSGNISATLATEFEIPILVLKD